MREELSGGLAVNIGIHFYDLLYWLFGRALYIEVYLRTLTRMAGFLELERARVRWFLSIEVDDVPKELRASGKRTYRSIAIDGEEIEFSSGFTDLHTEVYRRTLVGMGFGIDETAEAIRITEKLRHLPVARATARTRHPFLGS
jgi:UDP-N-acetyl-2-amino-2-deoxyglucuronate dehydrogenase